MSAAVEVAPADVEARLQAGEELYLLDVRHADAFERWHIDGSRNLPIYDQLERGETAPLERCIDAFPADVEIVVVCNTGNKSILAAAVLRAHGYDARSMADGMHGWGAIYRSYETPVEGVAQTVRPGRGCLSYLVGDGDAALVVDPGMHADVYRRFVEERDLRLVGVVDTHAHADHVSGAPDLADRFDVPYYLHGADARGRADVVPVDDGDELAVGARTLEVLCTPGHTRGSTCLALDGALLTGDTLFLRSVGRPDLDGDAAAARRGATRLHRSLRRILDYPGDTLVLPGHYAGEATRPVVATLDEVVAANDVLRLDRDAFVETILADLPETPANYARIKAINAGAEAPDDEAATLELGPNNCACE